jgi:hypothetical protein
MVRITKLIHFFQTSSYGSGSTTLYIIIPVHYLRQYLPKYNVSNTGSYTLKKVYLWQADRKDTIAQFFSDKQSIENATLSVTGYRY